MISLTTLIRATVLVCAATIGVPVVGQAASAAPQAIVMLPPGAKASAELAADITRWRKDGLVRDAIRLEATPQKEPGFSSLLLLEMTDEAAWDRWQKTEGPRLPADSRVRRADAVVHGERPDRDFANALFEVNVYRIKTTTESYREFCNGYIVPLMEVQADVGLMTWYTMYVERGAGGERNAVLVKAYRDSATYQRAAPLKLELRAKLTEQHPTYPKWHSTKDTLRDNVSETLAVNEPKLSR